jgi:spore maturation protein CgeB
MDYSPCLKIEPQGLWGDEYRMAINSFDISLGFVCRKNRDLHTTRSFEIPACQVLLVAIRTVDHSALFIEDREAVFFDGRDELISKVRYYLANPDAARKIALQGYLRCINSGYDHKSCSQKILNMLKG